MASYNELIKNFERIRAYMRDFYIYGFKSRDEYDHKSSRSYDDERRRIESWLGDYVRSSRTSDGKSLFLSIDTRVIEHNPLYEAWKTRSFTDGDITLHFILFDILHSPKVSLSLSEILERINNEYLSGFDAPMNFDESTVRGKLKEYCKEGILVAEKQGRKICYRRADDLTMKKCQNFLQFFSEVAPCGVIGSFLLDKGMNRETPLGFKHHYITSALDSDILALLFTAIRQKSAVFADNLPRLSQEPIRHYLVPLRIFASVQSGRQHLLAYQPSTRKIMSYRLDYLSAVVIDAPYEKYDDCLARLNELQAHMWGVSCAEKKGGTEHVEFTVYVGANEDYIVSRLEREKRIGRVERIDAHHYRFSADVLDSAEMIPWIRTFLCRITKMNFSNRTVENQFKRDVEEMCLAYGLKGGEQT